MVRKIYINCLNITFILFMFVGCGENETNSVAPVLSDSDNVNTLGAVEPVDKDLELNAPADIDVGKAHFVVDGIVDRVVLFDFGDKLTISARGTGMDANETYISQIFDSGSVASGPDACQQTIFDPADPGYLIDIQFLGFYADQRLSTTYSGADYVSLDKIGTVSFERVISVDPLVTERLACSKVTIRPALK